MDYNLTDRIRVFGHFIDNQQPTVAPYGSFVLGLTVPITQIANPIPGRSFAAGMTATISPTMTNEFNWGFTHNSILIDESGNVLKSNSDGINLPVLYPSAVQENYIPNVTFNGTRISASPGFGSGDAPFINYNTTIDTSDNLTKIWGKHTIKGGIYMQRSRKNQTSFANFNGSYNFGDNPSNPYDTGFGFSNALTGVYNTFNQAANHINGLYRYWNIEGFLEDTWKITPRVTLDYGVRTAWYQPQYDSGLSIVHVCTESVAGFEGPSPVHAGHQSREQPARRLTMRRRTPICLRSISDLKFRIPAIPLTESANRPPVPTASI